MLTWEGARGAIPAACPTRSGPPIEHELALIAQLDYAPYFLTVHDIVRFARSPGHPLPGARLGRQFGGLLSASASPRSIPTRVDLLFERFVSAERNEPPDIDVDFEHERREEVIQYIYGNYGRDRAGLAADRHLLSRPLGASARSARRWACRWTRWARWPASSGAGATKASAEAQLRELGLDPDASRGWR